MTSHSTTLLAVALACGPAVALADSLPIRFTEAELGATTDPTGLWRPAEIAEGGSLVQPSIWFATFPVDGGEVTLSILTDRWCGMSECPYRLRLVVPARRLDLRGEGMACQARELFTYDPVELTITACAQTIDLKELR